MEYDYGVLEPNKNYVVKFNNWYTKFYQKFYGGGFDYYLKINFWSISLNLFFNIRRVEKINQLSIKVRYSLNILSRLQKSEFFWFDSRDNFHECVSSGWMLKNFKKGVYDISIQTCPRYNFFFKKITN